MKESMKKYLSILTAAAVLLGGIQMPAAVKAQENVDSQAVTRETITVSTPEEFMQALREKKSPITVQGSITIGEDVDTDKRMLPVHIPANTVIQGTNGDEIIFRSPVQLEGDGVCFQNIGLIFISTDSLGSIPHREIFLAGHSLTLDNVNTYKKGGNGEPGSILGSEKELLPTVYAGGYTGTTNGNNASLKVINSNDETMFQAIYMGHDAGNDNKASYIGNATVNLDAKAVVREGVHTDSNTSAEINIVGDVNQYAKAIKFYGNQKTTLTIQGVSVENAEISEMGNVVLKDDAYLSPVTDTMYNVTLKNGACLDLNSIPHMEIFGNFTGEDNEELSRGILVLGEEGSLLVDGQITGTTQFQTKSKFYPGTLLPDRTYITALGNAVESNFVLAQKSMDQGFELKYLDGVWKTDPKKIREIGDIKILEAPSKVDLRKITSEEDGEISEGDPYFKVKWYDKEGVEFSDSEVEDTVNLFYMIDQVICVKTEYWNKNTQDDKSDFMQWITLSTLQEYPGRYYLQKCEGEGITIKTGDYTFLFLSSPCDLEQLYTMADVKALKDTVMAEQRVIFYDQDTEEPENPEHIHSYQSAVTKKATCTEKGIKTYTCSCGDKYTEEIAATGHKAVIEPAVAPTETTAGKTEGSHCSVCGRVLKVPQSIPALGKPAHTHSYQSAVTKKATSTKKGVITYTCGCGHKYTKEIASPNRKFTMNKTDFTYDGKVKTPSVTVKDSKGKSLKKDTDYKIKYPKGRKNPGVYTVTVEFRGNYSGKLTGSFTIKPKKTSLKKVTAKSKGMQVTWNKQKTQIDGYQIQYCTSGKFKGKTLKTATAKKNDTSKKISKLKGKKKYYVRIRTYKTVKVNGKSKKLYSDWSGKKTVNTKK